jgi:hypothetical protein
MVNINNTNLLVKDKTVETGKVIWWGAENDNWRGNLSNDHGEKGGAVYAIRLENTAIVIHDEAEA